MRVLYILLSISLRLSSFCQDGELDEQTVQGLENLAEKTEDALDDFQVREYLHYLKQPLNLNTAEEEELIAMNVLNDLQITNLLRYRKLLGPLIHIYELQAIPSWDLVTIKKLLPIITIEGGNQKPLQQVLLDGEQNLVIRYGNVIEAAKGFVDEKYLGSRAKVSMRYRYQYKSQLSWGISGEKDAGEPFLRFAQKTGFDFYGFHLFVKNIGRIRSLALGDYTVNLGQGLIHWQSLAFKKSAAVINIKRQSPVMRPYAATGEFNFLRGMGLTMNRNNLSGTLFLSYRKISANINQALPPEPPTISSFITSGNHRTAAEMQDRKVADQLTAGAVLRYAVTGWQLSFNSIFHRFSCPVLKQPEPYNLYAIRGSRFINNSIDYSFTHKNMHVFGELAVDRHLAFATIQGIMIAMDRNLDAAFLFRHISSRYQSITGNAFTENTLPNNETGFYAALTLRPAPSVSIDGYIDFFSFPWLKYRVNAISTGSEYLVSISYRPNKQVESYSRFRSSAKAINKTGSAQAIDPVLFTKTKHWRTHLAVKLSREMTLQNRFELSFFSMDGNSNKEGAMLFTDFSYKPALRRWSAHIRLQHFTIDTYEARIYAYEARMPFMYAIPLFYGNGIRYLLNVNYKITLSTKMKWKLQSSVAWMQTIYDRSGSIGSGLDTIEGKRRSEYSIQTILVKG